MKSNAVARRLLGLNHWRSNTQFVALVDSHLAWKTGKSVTAWVAKRTRFSDLFNAR